MAVDLGKRIRVARVRRNKSQEEVAQASGITRGTLIRIEQGDSGVAIGTVLTVLWALGLLSTVQVVADPDADRHGKILEASKRPRRIRAEKLDDDF